MVSREASQNQSFKVQKTHIPSVKRGLSNPKYKRQKVIRESQEILYEPTVSEMEILFHLMDYDGKGYVNRHDLHRIANMRNERLGIKDIETPTKLIKTDSFVNIESDEELSKESVEI